MTALELLKDLARRGVKIEAKGDKLRVSPAGAISPELRAVLMEHKAELMLWTLLDTWATLNEAEWTREAVDRLKNDILDVFVAHPGTADTWFHEWRQAHQEARLA